MLIAVSSFAPFAPLSLFAIPIYESLGRGDAELLFLLPRLRRRRLRRRRGRLLLIGCGRFGIVNYEELGLPASAQANAAYVLSPVIPQSDVFTDQFFRPFIRYGRHGDQLATSASPFKNPVIMADEGAVFVPTDPKVLDKPYLGRAVSGISKAMPATVHQGYAIHIPFRLELNYA